MKTAFFNFMLIIPPASPNLEVVGHLYFPKTVPDNHRPQILFLVLDCPRIRYRQGCLPETLTRKNKMELIATTRFCPGHDIV
nr:hypothetical protein [Mucilaginibacter xinganensis]